MKKDQAVAQGKSSIPSLFSYIFDTVIGKNYESVFNCVFST